MNIEQFNDFSKPAIVSKPREIFAEDFTVFNNDRTLLWGYDVDRNSFHVYMKDGQVYLLHYKGGNGTAQPMRIITQLDSFLSLDLPVPNKRLYPEACDVDFCKFLRNHGVVLPFTVFNKDRESKQFYGETL